MKLKLVIISLTTFLFIGCLPVPENKTSKTFSYELNENGCQTGAHSFNSREEMCDALRNDTLNNNCAQNLRYRQFQNDCPDRAW